MKHHISWLLVCFFYTAPCQAQDYKLKIGDSTYKVDLDKKYNVLINGKEMVISLSASDTLKYESKFASFDYLKGYSVSTTELGDGVTQVAIMSATGSGIILQNYSTMNPTSLNALMLSELTKESINYGYKMRREDYSRTTANGKPIKVEKAVLTYKDEINVYEIISYGKKDEGVLIVTMRMDDTPDGEGKRLIDLMWKTLRIH